MGQLFKNNAHSVLAAGIGAGDLSLSVSPGHGDRFPVVAAPDWAVVTLEDSSKNIEVVKVTARAAGSDAMTIVRAQEGTTARAWLAGDIAALRVTAGGLGQLQDDIATAAAAVVSHAAASDPHPSYLTPAEANAAYQPLDPDLSALAALITAANKLPYFTGAGSAALADFTAFARTLLDDTDAAAALATLGAQAALVSGTNIKTVGGQSLLGSGDVSSAWQVIEDTTVSAAGAWSNTALASGEWTDIKLLYSLKPSTHAEFYLRFNGNQGASDYRRSNMCHEATVGYNTINDISTHLALTATYNVYTGTRCDGEATVLNIAETAKKNLVGLSSFQNSNDRRMLVVVGGCTENTGALSSVSITPSGTATMSGRIVLLGRK